MWLVKWAVGHVDSRVGIMWIYSYVNIHVAVSCVHQCNILFRDEQKLQVCFVLVT